MEKTFFIYSILFQIRKALKLRMAGGKRHKSLWFLIYVFYGIYVLFFV